MAKLKSAVTKREPAALRPRRRRALAVSLAALACRVQVHALAADTTATWNSETNGNWTSTSLWSTSPNPPNNGTPAGINYQALINATGGTPYTVTLNSNISVDGLTIDSPDATVDQTADTLSPGLLTVTAGTYELDGGAISGGTVDSSGGSFINASTGMLDGTPAGGITLVGQMLAGVFGTTTYLQGLINDPSGFTIDQATKPPIAHGFVVSYTISLSADTELTGNGTTTTITNQNNSGTEFAMASLGGQTGNERLTIDAGHTLLSQTVVSSSGRLALTNNGILQADGLGTFASSGFLRANGIQISLNQDDSNNAGTIEATIGASVELDNTRGASFVNSGNILANTGASVTLSFSSNSGFTNSGSMLSDGTGSLLVLSDSAISSGGVNNPGNFTNNGTIRATGGASATIDASSIAVFINNGTIRSDGTGSLLVIKGIGVSNGGSGTIEAINGATVELQQFGNFIYSGPVTVGAQSTFSIGVGSTLDNTGSTVGSTNILLPPSEGTLQLNGGAISGGTVNSAGGNFLNISSGTLDGTPAGGITLLGTLLHANGATTELKGLINDPNGFTFESALGGTNGYNISLSGDTELSGNGTTTTLLNGAYIRSATGIESLTIDSGHTLLSLANTGGFFVLNNEGTIQADGSGYAFGLGANRGSSANGGVIEATNGAKVSVDYQPGSTFTNSGSILATGAGSTVAIGGVLSNVGPGIIQAINGATLALTDGTFTNFSSFATFNINNGLATAGAGDPIVFSGGVLDNTGTAPGSSSLLHPTAGAAFDLIGGTIRGGTVNSAGGKFINNGQVSGATLDGTPIGGITLVGTLLSEFFYSTTDLKGMINDPMGFTFDADLPVGTYNLVLSSDTEFSGNGTTTTLANSDGYSVGFGGWKGSERLTIDSGHTLLSRTIVVPPNFIVDNVTHSMALTNDGTIQVDGSNHQFYLEFSDTINTNIGTIEATNGGDIILDSSLGGTFMNSGSVLADGVGSVVRILGNGFSDIQSGSIQMRNGAELSLRNATINTPHGLDIGTGTLTGSGTINGNLTLDSDPSTLAFNIGGETQGGNYDSLTINGTTILAGDLQITLTNSFLPLESDIFTVLQVDADDTLTGSFLNVPDGGRLETADGTGSFQVLYGSSDFPNEIVLEDFQPSPASIPEPASIAIIATPLTLLLRRKRRA